MSLLFLLPSIGERAFEFHYQILTSSAAYATSSEMFLCLQGKKKKANRDKKVLFKP